VTGGSGQALLEGVLGAEQAEQSEVSESSDRRAQRGSESDSDCRNSSDVFLLSKYKP
jgi:hypothetical protein